MSVEFVCLYDDDSVQHMDATFFLAIYYVAYAYRWIMLKPMHKRLLHIFHFSCVRGIKRYAECGGLACFNRDV